MYIVYVYDICSLYIYLVYAMGGDNRKKEELRWGFYCYW